ncbi:MAG: hypothetical protein LC098_05270 [Burkholderiales bacterium]|nr:hypothetical protein [Burkholderiales bacterium]
MQATSVEVSKLLVAIPDGKVYGRPHQGLACLGNPPLVWKGGTSTISEGPLLARVVDVLSSAGLKLSQSRDELFATPDKQGDLVLAGKIVDLEWVTCGEYTYSGRKGSAYVAIEWQVFSRAAGAVLLTTRTEGSFATEEFKPSNNNVVFLAGAVESAAKNLLANPDFRKLLTVSPPRSNPRMT